MDAMEFLKSKGVKLDDKIVPQQKERSEKRNKMSAEWKKKFDDNRNTNGGKKIVVGPKIRAFVIYEMLANMLDMKKKSIQVMFANKKMSIHNPKDVVLFIKERLGVM